MSGIDDLLHGQGSGFGGSLLGLQPDWLPQLAAPAEGAAVACSTSVGGANAVTGGSDSEGAAPAASPRQQQPSPLARSAPLICQADGCDADLTTQAQHLQRSRVCPDHLRAGGYLVGGVASRFCPCCRKSQPLHEFEEGKRCCVRSLERRMQRRCARCGGWRAGQGCGCSTGRGSAQTKPPLPHPHPAGGAAPAPPPPSRRQQQCQWPRHRPRQWPRHRPRPGSALPHQRRCSG